MKVILILLLTLFVHTAFSQASMVFHGKKYLMTYIKSRHIKVLVKSSHEIVGTEGKWLVTFTNIGKNYSSYIIEYKELSEQCSQ